MNDCAGIPLSFSFLFPEGRMRRHFSCKALPSNLKASTVRLLYIRGHRQQAMQTINRPYLKVRPVGGLQIWAVLCLGLGQRYDGRLSSVSARDMIRACSALESRALIGLPRSLENLSKAPENAGLYQSETYEPEYLYTLRVHARCGREASEM